MSRIKKEEGIVKDELSKGRVLYQRDSSSDSVL